MSIPTKIDCRLLKVDGLYEVIPLRKFRRTPSVAFDILSNERFRNVAGFDRVVHKSDAVSPGPVGRVARPWYMHPYQDDNLLVFHGIRYVDIYTVAHGRIESFEIQPDLVIKNGEILFDGPAMLVWPKGVFHRIVSGPDGSASLNLAVRTEGFDVDTEFNIYDVNTEEGTYRMIRAGHEDQFDM